jgi:hypothetical protein
MDAPLYDTMAGLKGTRTGKLEALSRLSTIATELFNRNAHGTGPLLYQVPFSASS